MPVVAVVSMAALVVLACRLPGDAEPGGDLRLPDGQVHGVVDERREFRLCLIPRVPSPLDLLKHLGAAEWVTRCAEPAGLAGACCDRRDGACLILAPDRRFDLLMDTRMRFSRAPRCITLPNGSLRIRWSEYQRWLASREERPDERRDDVRRQGLPDRGLQGQGGNDLPRPVEGGRPLRSGILARIWHSDLHLAAPGRIRLHTRLTGKITKTRRFRRSQTASCGFGEWGGWGSNPRPADYEKYGPKHRTRYLHR